MSQLLLRVLVASQMSAVMALYFTLKTEFTLSRWVWAWGESFLLAITLLSLVLPLSHWIVKRFEKEVAMKRWFIQLLEALKDAFRIPHC